MRAVSTFVLVILAASTAFSQQGADYALRFNGVTDFLGSAQRLPTINTFTIEAWVKPTAEHQIDSESQSGYAGIEGQRYAVYPSHGTHLWGRGHAGAGFSVGTNGVSVYEHTGGAIPAVLVVETPIRGWTHVAVVYNDRIPSLYLNGRLVRTGVRSACAFVHPSTGDNHTGRMIGGIGGGAYGYFEGELDNVRIWGQPLSAADLRLAAGGTLDGATAMVSFDMNRTGSGTGLAVNNVTRAATTLVHASTFGTDVTPVFTPRAERAQAASSRACPDVSNPLDPAVERPRSDPRSSPVLR